MKNQIATEDCGDQVYVITLDTAADGENLHDFLEQHDYDFFTVSERSESFRHIQDAIPLPEVSAQQNDSASDFREESLPRTEAVAPQETPLSRAGFHGNYDDILGESVEHLEVLECIEMFAESSQTVLISGETGTGKELVAAALHAQSTRVGHAMVAVNCGAIEEHLIKSEFFGHEKGRLPAQMSNISGYLKRHQAARCFLMKSVNSRGTYNRICCGYFRKARFGASAGRNRFL